MTVQDTNGTVIKIGDKVIRDEKITKFSRDNSPRVVTDMHKSGLVQLDGVNRWLPAKRLIVVG